MRPALDSLKDLEEMERCLQREAEVSYLDINGGRADCQYLRLKLMPECRFRGGSRLSTHTFRSTRVAHAANRAINWMVLGSHCPCLAPSQVIRVTATTSRNRPSPMVSATPSQLTADQPEYLSFAFAGIKDQFDAIMASLDRIENKVDQFANNME